MQRLFGASRIYAWEKVKSWLASWHRGPLEHFVILILSIVPYWGRYISVDNIIVTLHLAVSDVVRVCLDSIILFHRLASTIYAYKPSHDRNRCESNETQAYKPIAPSKRFAPQQHREIHNVTARRTCHPRKGRSKQDQARTSGASRWAGQSTSHRTAPHRRSDLDPTLRTTVETHTPMKTSSDASSQVFGTAPTSDYVSGSLPNPDAAGTIERRPQTPMRRLAASRPFLVLRLLRPPRRRGIPRLAARSAGRVARHGFLQCNASYGRLWLTCPDGPVHCV